MRYSVLGALFLSASALAQTELPYEASWARPDTRVDGSPLPADVPLTYELYADAVPGEEWTLIATTTEQEHSGVVTVAEGEPGARFCVIAVEAPGLFSDCSEEALKAVPRERRFPPPAPFPSRADRPADLTVR